MCNSHLIFIIRSCKFEYPDSSGTAGFLFSSEFHSYEFIMQTGIFWFLKRQLSIRANYLVDSGTTTVADSYL